MKAFAIENETNNIMVHASAKEAEAVENAVSFRNEAGLAKLAADWPAARLIEVWNSLPGVTPVKKFTNRNTAIRRIWAQIQSLGERAPAAAVADVAVASWAGMCPGTNESAGKQKSGKTRKGNRYLRRILLQAAWAATRQKDSYLRAFFFRLQHRRGWGKAIIALGHKLLRIVYEILKTRTPYSELGAHYYDQLNPEKTISRLVARLEHLGVEVQLKPQNLSNA